MWVIPKNLQASSGLLAGLETIKDSAELSQICAVSLFVRGKDTQSATWLRRWKKDGWHQRLSGRIAAPSPGNHSLVEGWISSLLPIRAKVNPLPATNSASTILDSYGRIVETSLQQLDLFSAFLKTSEATSTPQWSKSSATWQSFSTQLSQEYSARKSAAAAIRGRGFLSWRDGWKTPTVPNGGRVNPAGTSETGIDPNGVKRQIRLEQQASKIWPTPTANCMTGAGSEGREGGLNLQSATAVWPTPTVHGDHNRKGASESSGDGLSTASKQWMTPRATDAEHGGPNQWGSRGDVMLPSQAANWPTPNLQDSEQAASGKAGHLTLNRSAVKLWPTPVANDDNKSPEAHMAMKARMKGGERFSITSLNVAVKAFPSPLPAPTMLTGGLECFTASPSSHLRSDNRKLNVFFVEWLMGWPMNHTCTRCGACSVKIGLTVYGCLETESTPTVQP